MRVIKFLAIIGLLSGCAMQTKQVRVLKSDTEIRIIRLSIEDGDVMACDNNTCRVVAK